MKNILVLGGKTTDYHDFSVMGPIFEDFLTRLGYNVTITENLSHLLPESIRTFDVIIDYTTERSINAAQEQGLLNAIIGSPWGDTGGPKLYIGIHGATTSYQSSNKVLKMIGARFLTHPPLQEIQVKVEDKDHPIMSGITDFSIKDELYLQDYYPPFETLLSTKYKDFIIPLAWVKSYGRGAVFYIGLGHGKEQLEDTSFQSIVKNALHYWFSSND